jgi:hypothetical protein
LEFGGIARPKQFRVSFTAKVFSKLRPEKYDFDLYNGSFMGKMDHILQISKKKNSTSPESYDNLQ